ncbi:MAG: hypothetical protein K6B65_05695 [Bacilli bacterium]|nr:hypothetical protein [Bacilli bacterium]
MNLFLDAKNRIDGSKDFISYRVLSSFLQKGLSPLASLDIDNESLLKEFELSKEREEGPILIQKLSTFLALEDILLSIADYILSKTSLREFDKAIKLEEVRQFALLPIMKANSWLCDKLGSPSLDPVLARHTPKGR